MFFVDPMEKELIIPAVGSFGVSADDGYIIEEVNAVVDTLKVPEDFFAASAFVARGGGAPFQGGGGTS